MIYLGHTLWCRLCAASQQMKTHSRHTYGSPFAIWWRAVLRFYASFVFANKFCQRAWLLSPLFYFSPFISVCLDSPPVENTVRNGYKATKSQLNASLKQIASCIERLVGALGKQSIDRIPSLIEKNNVIKAITLNRQCERFLYDLLNSLAEQQVHIDRHLKTYRSQLNKIHEIVKFRTAIPISSIFVSIKWTWWTRVRSALFSIKFAWSFVALHY